jgi:hypothetical protein
VPCKALTVLPSAWRFKHGKEDSPALYRANHPAL